MAETAQMWHIRTNSTRYRFVNQVRTGDKSAKAPPHLGELDLVEMRVTGENFQRQMGQLVTLDTDQTPTRESDVPGKTHTKRI